MANQQQSSSSLALDPPEGELCVLSSSLVDEAVVASRRSPRKRIVQPFHKGPEDPLHRMLNAMQPGTYVRPHRHREPPKSEAWIVLRGAVLFLWFADDGKVIRHVRLEAAGEHFGIDLLPGHYHSLIALEEDTVLYEVKPGPYEQASDKSFAPWAPEEGTDEASRYLESLLDRFPP